MSNGKPRKLRLRKVLCALAALALLTQGAMAEADIPPEVAIEDAPVEITIEGATPDEGELIVGLADEIVPEDVIPAPDALLLDGLDGLDGLDCANGRCQPNDPFRRGRKDDRWRSRRQ